MRPWPPSPKPGNASSHRPSQLSHYCAIADVLAGTSARLWTRASLKGNLIFFLANLMALHCSTHRGACFFFVFFLWKLLSSEAGPSKQIPENLLFLCSNDQMSSRAALFSQSEATWRSKVGSWSPDFKADNYNNELCVCRERFHLMYTVNVSDLKKSW